MSEGPILGWLRRIFDRLAKDAYGRLAVTAHSSIGNDVNDGIVFAAGAEIALTSGQNGSLTIDNPASSGVVMVIGKLQVWHSVVDSLDVIFIKNPTVTGGTVLIPFNLNQGSANTSSAIITSGVGILSGGTAIDIHARSARDNHYILEGAPVIIPPGVRMSFQIQAPGGLTGGTDVSASAVWKEVVL